MGDIDAALVEQVRAVLDLPRPWAVTQIGHPVLRTPAHRYDGQLPERLLHELLDGMREHLPGVGVGLAAPQIGIPLALAVIEDPATVAPDVLDTRERSHQPLLELINPTITPTDDERVAFFEGCLSVEGLTAVVARHRRVLLTATDRTGTVYRQQLQGWPARIAQHETDHLNGLVYLDRAELRSLSSVDNYLGFWNQPGPENAAEALGFAVPPPPHR